MAWPAAASVLSRLLDNPAAVSLNSPLRQSPLAAALHAYPRFGLPNDVALSARYFLGAGLAAVPWLIVAVVCLFLSCCAAACCGPLAKTRRRARKAGGSSGSEGTGSGHGGKRAVWALVAGVLLCNAAFWLVGTGLIATYSFYSGVRDVFMALGYGADGVFGAAVNMAKFAVVVLDKVEASGSVGAAFSAILKDIGTLRSQAKEFVRQAEVLLGRTNSILSAARRAGLGVYALLIVVFLLLLAGLLLVFSASSRRRRHRSTSCVMFLMIFPLVLSWVAVGVVTTAAVLLGDACFMLGDYHKLILDRAVGSPYWASGIDASKNVIYAKGVTCPTDYISRDVLDSLHALVVEKTNARLADSVFAVIFPGKDTQGVADYSRNLFTGLSDCSSMVRFAGRLHQATCQRSGPVLGLFVIWTSLMLLALVLTGAFFTAQYSSFDPMRLHTPLSRGKSSNPSHTGLSLSDSGSMDLEGNGTEPVVFEGMPLATATGRPGTVGGLTGVPPANYGEFNEQERRRQAEWRAGQ
jgi:hypothetical protein